MAHRRLHTQHGINPIVAVVIQALLCQPGFQGTVSHVLVWTDPVVSGQCVQGSRHVLPVASLAVDGLLNGSGPPADQGLRRVPGGANGNVGFALAQAVNLIGNDNFQLDVRIVGAKRLKRRG